MARETAGGDSGLELRELKQRMKRRTESLEFLQLITKTFVSLSLTGEEAVCDTLIALLTSFLDARRGAVLLQDEGAFRLVGHKNIPDPGELVSGKAHEMWRSIMNAKVARFVTGDQVGSLWTTPPSYLEDGFAAVAIDVEERPVGVILLADRLSGKPFSNESLEFLSTSAGIAALILTNETSRAAQQALILESRRETEQKELALQRLDQKLQVIEEQQRAIRMLSTPIITIWDRVLTLPIIGFVDSARTDVMTRSLLEAVTASQARCVIIDITGVDVVGADTVSHFLDMVSAVELLGAECFITGVSPQAAQNLAALGVDLSRLRIRRNLQEGLRSSFEIRGFAVARIAERRATGKSGGRPRRSGPPGSPRTPPC